jgi:hypothetical protein
MAEVPYKVYVIVDRDFGEKIIRLDQGAPVWIVDTTTNKPVVQRFWNEHPDKGHLAGITTFDDVRTSSPEDMLLSHLNTIELHHGSYSADPPFTMIEVFGTELTDKAKSRLSEYGFNEFQVIPGGFKAIRPKPLA